MNYITAIPSNFHVIIKKKGVLDFVLDFVSDHFACCSALWCTRLWKSEALYRHAVFAAKRAMRLSAGERPCTECKWRALVLQREELEKGAKLFTDTLSISLSFLSLSVLFLPRKTPNLPRSFSEKNLRGTTKGQNRFGNVSDFFRPFPHMFPLFPPGLFLKLSWGIDKNPSLAHFKGCWKVFTEKGSEAVQTKHNNCEQRSSAVSRKLPTVSKKLHPLKSGAQVVGG